MLLFSGDPISYGFWIKCGSFDRSALVFLWGKPVMGTSIVYPILVSWVEIFVSRASEGNIASFTSLELILFGDIICSLLSESVIVA